MNIYQLTLQGLSRDGAVPLSNSLSLADRHRMNYITKHNKNKENIDSCPFKYGMYILVFFKERLLFVLTNKI